MATDPAKRTPPAATPPGPPPREQQMVFLPGGAYAMGTPAAEIPALQARYGIGHAELLAPEVPQHRVHVGPFCIDRYPVTNAQFAAFLEAQPQWQPDRIVERYHNGDYLQHWHGSTYPAGKARHPVVYVSWYAAMAYAHWAGKRLPSEAEWEYAARGGVDGAQFPWGDDPPDPSRANYAASEIGEPTTVGSYPPNPLGLYDVAGNVWEYCLDEWQGDYYARSPVHNPIAAHPASAGDAFLQVTTRRVIRGGSFGGAPVNLRVTYRDSHLPDGAGSHVGFRCVRSAQQNLAKVALTFARLVSTCTDQNGR